VPNTRQPKAVVQGTAPLLAPDTVGALGKPIADEADEGQVSLVKAPVSTAIPSIVKRASAILRLGERRDSVPPFRGEVSASSGCESKIKAVARARPSIINAEDRLVRLSRLLYRLVGW